MTAQMNYTSRGFTLIEVVVSIALFALLMGIVYSGFSIAVRAYDAAESRVGSVERMRVISAFIRRSVSGAQALAVADRGTWAVQFDGEANRVRYVADLPGYVGISGLHEMVLELEPSGDQQDLVLRRRALSVGSDGQLQGDFDTRVLADGIKSFELRFFGRSNNDAEPTWETSWQSAKHMPLLVEMSVTPFGEANWPLLQVQPRVDAIRYVRFSGGSVGQRAPPGSTPSDESDDSPAGSSSNNPPKPDPEVEPAAQ